MPSPGRPPAARDSEGKASPPPPRATLSRAAADAYERLGLAICANLALVLGSAAGVLPAWAIARTAPDWAPSLATALYAVLVWPALWLAMAALCVGLARGGPVGPRTIASALWSRYLAAVLHTLLGLLAAVLLWVTIAFWSAARLTGSPIERLVALVWVAIGLVGLAAWVHGWSLLALRAAGAGALYRSLRLMTSDRRGSAVLVSQVLLVVLLLSLPLWSHWQGVAATFAVMLALFFAFFWLALVSAHVALAGSSERES